MRKFLLLAALLLASTSNGQLLEIMTVLVGDPGNPNDYTGYGQVDYNYHIGAHEVTNAQYAQFLNSVATTDTHGLHNFRMGRTHGGIERLGIDGDFSYTVRPGYENRPVIAVSFWNAARFANWLTNGQPTGTQGDGTTETGMYNLGGVTEPDNRTIMRDPIAWANGGVAITSINEWYKAAYYDPTKGGTSNYWSYPTRSNTPPTGKVPNDTDPNSGNFNLAVGTLTDVGAYSQAVSYYGTFDQWGNLGEWTDSILVLNFRKIRGGSFSNFDFEPTFSSANDGFTTPNHIGALGFRISSLQPIPEPSTYAAILGGVVMLISLVRRRALKR